MLFLLWSDQPHRPTRDVDFLGFGDSGEADLRAIFRELCDIPVEDDGLTLVADSVQVEVIRDQTEYGGLRVRLFGDLAGARVTIQADIGFGDAVTPEAEEIEYPTLLGNPAPHLIKGVSPRNRGSREIPGTGQSGYGEQPDEGLLRSLGYCPRVRFRWPDIVRSDRQYVLVPSYIFTRTHAIRTQPQIL